MMTKVSGAKTSMLGRRNIASRMANLVMRKMPLVMMMMQIASSYYYYLDDNDDDLGSNTYDVCNGFETRVCDENSNRRSARNVEPANTMCDRSTSMDEDDNGSNVIDSSFTEDDQMTSKMMHRSRASSPTTTVRPITVQAIPKRKQESVRQRS